ncbi:MAG: ATP-binding protein, partial [Mariprofundus sp.]
MKLPFYSLRSRIFLSITAIVVVLSLVFGWVSIIQQTSSLEQELIERGQITARHLAYGVELGILTHDTSGLEALLKKLMKEKDLLYAEVYNSDGEVITSAVSEALNNGWSDPDADMESSAQPAAESWMKGKLGDREVYEFHMSVISEINATDENMLLDEPGDMVRQMIGGVHVALSTHSIRTAINKTIMDAIGTFMILLLFALLTAWWLARALTRPLEHMGDVIEKTKSGDLNRRIDLVGQNEITQLGMTFNRMLDTLAERDKNLHTQQRLMQVLLDAAPVGIWMLGMDRRVTFMNKAFAQAVGIPEQAFVDAEHYADLLPEEVASQCIESDERCFEMKALVTSQEHIPCVDGKTHIFDIVKAPLQNEQGEMTGLVGIAIDATYRLEADAEKEQMQKQVEHTQRLESLGVLAGGITHDFNNLLTSIMGSAALAEQKIMDDPAMGKEHLSRIVLSSEKAALLCKQMLAYSGKGHFIIKPVNLSSMVESVTSLLGVSIHRTIELKYRMSEQLPNIEADEAQLQQVVMNLVINASDAIGEMSGVISIATGVMHADAAYLSQTTDQSGIALDAGDYVYLEVSDTGCGMSQETQQRLFEPFYTTKFTGRGLGMSAVQGIVRGHHGAMFLQSEPDKGTTFRVLFPASAAITKGISSSSEQLTDAWKPAGSVLIIDDEEMIRETAAMMLEGIGFETLSAVDGLDGVEVYRQHQDKIAAVLLDMTMPKLDGHGCFRELKRINPQVKVVLSSGYNEQEATSQFT